MGHTVKRVHRWSSIVLLLLVASLAEARGAFGADLRLVQAVKDGDKRAVASLLKERVDVNAAPADGATALMWAAHRGDVETADLLIRAGARVNATNDYGVSALLLACANGSAASVEKLLKAGANPNVALMSNGETPLMTAARTGSADGATLLLAYGADVNAKETRRGQSALMWAVAEQHPEVAQVLIERGADIHAHSKSGFTPLLFAVRVGNLDTVRFLLGAGAKVDEATSEDGTALVVAAASGHEALAMFLLEKGADPNAIDAYGMSALHYAVARGLANLSAVEYSTSREPPPHLSAMEHYLFRLPPSDMPELAKALLSRGANPNARIAKDYGRGRAPFRQYGQLTLVGATPFFLAAAAHDPSLMRMLLASGADPSLGANGDSTAVMVAAGMGRCQDFLEGEESRALEAVKLTVELGGDVNAVNVRGQTALHAAAYAGADSIIQFLADKGAKIDPKDEIGQTPWSAAMAIVQRPNDKGAVRLHESTANLLRRLGATPITHDDLAPYHVGDRVVMSVRYLVAGESESSRRGASRPPSDVGDPAQSLK